MNRVFSSEWLKIARPVNIFGWMAPVVLFAFMGTMFNFMDASTDAGQFRGPFGFAPGLEQLAAPDGWIIGIHSASSFIGLIALAIFATNMARDYEKGTIRILLVMEPNRFRFFFGKLLTLSSFVVLITAGATVVTMLAWLCQYLSSDYYLGTYRRRAGNNNTLSGNFHIRWSRVPADIRVTDSAIC
jgi:hypothetical protein